MKTKANANANEQGVSSTTEQKRAPKPGTSKNAKEAKAVKTKTTKATKATKVKTKVVAVAKNDKERSKLADSFEKGEIWSVKRFG